MKFNCDRFEDWLYKKIMERQERLSKTHKWFAWYPIKIDHGDCRWLEYVNRKYTFGDVIKFIEYSELEET